MARFDIHPTPIKGLTIIERHPIGDQRGFLARLFCREELHSVVGERPLVQINHTLTATKGTIRGMHFQHPPHAEMKLVTCLRGEVFDVAVDLRSDSPTFLHWYAEHLSSENCKTLALPEGFAHGFQTLTNHCELLYFHTAAYQPTAESGLDALDPRLGIKWPHPVTERSERDQSHPAITPDFNGLIA